MCFDRFGPNTSHSGYLSEVNTHLIELASWINCTRRSSAWEGTLVQSPRRRRLIFLKLSPYRGLNSQNSKPLANGLDLLHCERQQRTPSRDSNVLFSLVHVTHRVRPDLAASLYTPK